MTELDPNAVPHPVWACVVCFGPLLAFLLWVAWKAAKA